MSSLSSSSLSAKLLHQPPTPPAPQLHLFKSNHLLNYLLKTLSPWQTTYGHLLDQLACKCPMQVSSSLMKMFAEESCHRNEKIRNQKNMCIFFLFFPFFHSLLLCSFFSVFHLFLYFLHFHPFLFLFSLFLIFPFCSPFCSLFLSFLLFLYFFFLFFIILFSFFPYIFFSERKLDQSVRLGWQSSQPELDWLPSMTISKGNPSAVRVFFGKSLHCRCNQGARMVHKREEKGADVAP